MFCFVFCLFLMRKHFDSGYFILPYFYVTLIVIWTKRKNTSNRQKAHIKFIYLKTLFLLSLGWASLYSKRHLNIITIHAVADTPTSNRSNLDTNLTQYSSDNANLSHKLMVVARWNNVLLHFTFHYVASCSAAEIVVGCRWFKLECNWKNTYVT